MSKSGSRARNEHGAAVVETALCICFIVLPLVFGIISYAYMLSFRQTVSQSAAEGARAAAVAPSSATPAVRRTVALGAIDDALATGSGGLKCNESNVTCTVSDPVVGCGDGQTGVGSCVTVTVQYPYRDHSLLPTIPGLGFTLPKMITYSSTARVS